MLTCFTLTNCIWSFSYPSVNYILSAERNVFGQVLFLFLMPMYVFLYTHLYICHLFKVWRYLQ